MPVERRTWERLAAHIVQTQCADGSWGYRPGDAATPTMSLAGLTVAAACRSVLARAKVRGRDLDRIDASVEAGLAHLGANWYLDRPRDKGPLDRWFYYGCYGMERAAAIAGVEGFGAHAWYPEVASVLCDEQKADGSWSNPWEKRRG